MTEGIRNKVVVITGASSGLGEAAPRRLAEDGTKLVLGVRSPPIPSRAVAFAMSQPEDVDINEILFRPTSQAY